MEGLELSPIVETINCELDNQLTELIHVETDSKSNMDIGTKYYIAD